MLDTGILPGYTYPMKQDTENQALVLEGMEWIQLYTACQALMAPTKFYRFTHKHCKERVQDLIGFCPKGKPGTAQESKHLKGWRAGGKEAILDWLGVVHIETHKTEGCVLPSDRTLLILKDR